MRLKAILVADLIANVGRSGLRAGLSAAFLHPGFGTILLHRTATALVRNSWPRLANLIWRFNIAWSGCHIHLSAEIGPGLILPHPTGIVVGAGCRLGENVTLYQNTTLGRGRSTERYPSVGHRVIVYPNAVIVGDIVVGDDAVVGAGSVVIKDVPAGVVVTGNPARVIRSQRELRATAVSASEDNGG